MQFRTEIPIKKYKSLIDYRSKILLLGSCFAENIGEKFQYFKFQAEVNPFGIIFNPVSLEKLIRRVVEQHYFTEDDIFFHNDLWHCFEVHSELSNSNKEVFLKQLNQLVELTHQQIKELTHLQITLGTAWVYRNIASKEIVANCHKVPQKEFTKELLSVSQIEESLQSIITLVHSINPNCQFIFTVSPVRHIKDGFVENNVSKAHLLSAVYKMLSSRAESRDNYKGDKKQVLDFAKTDIVVNYFPSYEIMIDELRDYRFYKQDMLHPNEVAIDYIWEKFSKNYIKESQFEVMNEVNSIQKALQHKPFNPNTEAHQQFLEKLKERITTIQKHFPFIKF